MNLSLPLNFGRRACDRLLVRALPSLPRETVLWMAVLVWQDFATAREDRRQVPLEARARAGCDAVAILEEFTGWSGEPGQFIQAAIDAGFFLLTAVTEDTAELVLAEFHPMNASASRVTNSELGGVMKAYKRIQQHAEIAASDQLRLFESTGGLSLPGVSELQTKAALLLIHSVCIALKRQAPSDETWKGTLIPKAVAVVTACNSQERAAVLRWFIKNRADQRIPLRLDFILDQFKDFVPDAVASFARSA